MHNFWMLLAYLFIYLLIYLFIYLLFRLPCSCIFSCSSNCYSYLCKCVHTMTKLSSPNSVCKIQQFFHLRMCVKYGILKKQILTILEKQSVVFSGKIFFKIWTSMTWFILFNKTVENILRNLIPHEKITCDEIHLGLIVQ